MTLIKVKDLYKAYNNNIIINHINYEFKAGNVYGITGRNGIGKSVLIKMLLGMTSPDSGSVEYAKIDNNNLLVSCVIDGCDLHMELTGIDNLTYLSKFLHRVTKEDIRNSLIAVGLEPDNKLKVKKYSLGMKKRLLIAQAIMEDPDVIMLDEPTNSLDSEGIKLLHKIVKEYKNKGKLIIIASHYKEDINTLCDEILELKDGVLC